MSRTLVGCVNDNQTAMFGQVGNNFMSSNVPHQFDVGLLGGNSAGSSIGQGFSSNQMAAIGFHGSSIGLSSLRYTGADRSGRITNPYQVVPLMGKRKAYSADEPLVPPSAIPFRSATASSKARRAENQPLNSCSDGSDCRSFTMSRLGGENSSTSDSNSAGYTIGLNQQATPLPLPPSYSADGGAYPADRAYSSYDDEQDQLEDFSEHTYATVLNGSELYLPGHGRAGTLHTRNPSHFHIGSQSECSSCDATAFSSGRNLMGRPITEL